jgi:hypothetical protein
MKCEELEVHDVDRMDVRCVRVVSVPVNKGITENQGWNPVWGIKPGLGARVCRILFRMVEKSCV